MRINVYHIEFLNNEIRKRKIKNPRYSLRAFAKYLDISASSLSRILSGQQEISVDIVKKIVVKFNVSDEEKILIASSMVLEKNKASCHEIINVLLPNRVMDKDAILTDVFPSFSWILSSTTSIVLKICNKGKVLYINEAGAQLIGSNVRDVVGQNIFDFVEADQLQDIIHDIFKQKTERKTEIRYKKGSSSIWLDVVVTPILGYNGRIIKFAIICRDITVKKKELIRLNYLKDITNLIMGPHTTDAFLTFVGSYIVKNDHQTDGCLIVLKKNGLDEIVFCSHDGFKDYLNKDLNTENSLLSHIPSNETWLKDMGDITAFFSKEHQHIWEIAGIRSMLLIPLFDKNECMGVVIVSRSESKDDFTPEDFYFSSKLGSRLQHALIYRKLLGI